jgi:hypothetical protein
VTPSDTRYFSGTQINSNRKFDDGAHVASSIRSLLFLQYQNPGLNLLLTIRGMDRNNHLKILYHLSYHHLYHTIPYHTDIPVRLLFTMSSTTTTTTTTLPTVLPPPTALLQEQVTMLLQEVGTPSGCHRLLCPVVAKSRTARPSRATTNIPTTAYHAESHEGGLVFRIAILPFLLFIR